MERMTIQTALSNLCVNYGKYGMSREDFYKLLKSGIDMGLSVRSAYNGIKMTIALNTGEHEVFTIDDVMDITGESREEVLERIEELKAELIAQGKDTDDYFTQGEQRTKYIIRL